MKRVDLQPSYVLHRRPYRETSFLIELFTQDHGRLSVIAKGVRKQKSSTQGILQPFTPLLISWVGKGELMTLTHVESRGEIKRLQGDCLFAGFYLNELLMCLLQKWDVHAGIFSHYEKTLSALLNDRLEETCLRVFEKDLLDELGYGVLPKSDAALDAMILADKHYRYVPEQGFMLAEFIESDKAASNLFSGKSLLAIAKEDWEVEEALKDAKRLTRLALAPLLESRSLHSRKLFLQLAEKPNY